MIAVRRHRDLRHSQRNMKIETIADIYSANEVARQRLLAVLAGVSAEQASVRPEGEEWSVEQIVEHLSMVEGGVSRICAKLVDRARADGRPADGTAVLSVDFLANTKAAAESKIQAPERVQPSGEQRIGESIAKLIELRAALGELRSDLETYDLTAHHFPHPVFGDMTAHEWLLLLGWHEARHTAQIERILPRTADNPSAIA